jgi:nitrite reductase/ring-hydroxylating ferredoxin subunit
MPIIRRIPVCKTGEVPVSSTHSFAFGPSAKGIVYNDAGTLRAYVNRCTHMGGPLDACGTEKLRCRWHQAEFDPKTGAAIRGEAPAGTFLKQIELVCEGDTIFALLELPDDPFA